MRASRSFLLDGGAGRKSHHLWDNLGSPDRVRRSPPACPPTPCNVWQDNFISESWLRS
jgi:hypothetical protein